MDTATRSTIQGTTAFVKLVARRRKVVTWLTSATIIPYYVFIIISAYKPGVLAIRVTPSSFITLGWIVGVLLIIGTWFLTGLYVRYANGEFDQLAREIGAEVE